MSSTTRNIQPLIAGGAVQLSADSQKSQEKHTDPQLNFHKLCSHLAAAFHCGWALGWTLLRAAKTQPALHTAASRSWAAKSCTSSIDKGKDEGTKEFGSYRWDGRGKQQSPGSASAVQNAAVRGGLSWWVTAQAFLSSATVLSPF